MFALPDRTVSVNKSIAMKYGVQTAVVYNEIHRINLNSGEVSATAYNIKEALDFLTLNQIKRSLRNLESGGDVFSDTPFISQMDRTKRYSVNEMINNG